MATPPHPNFPPRASGLLIGMAVTGSASRHLQGRGAQSPVHRERGRSWHSGLVAGPPGRAASIHARACMLSTGRAGAPPGGRLPNVSSPLSLSPGLLDLICALAVHTQRSHGAGRTASGHPGWGLQRNSDHERRGEGRRREEGAQGGHAGEQALPGSPRRHTPAVPLSTPRTQVLLSWCPTKATRARR